MPVIRDTLIDCWVIATIILGHLHITSGAVYRKGEVLGRITSDLGDAYSLLCPTYRRYII